MTYQVRYRGEVPDDIRAAMQQYEKIDPRLSDRFLVDLEATLARIESNPELYAPGHRDVRSARLRRFPYLVHYRIVGGSVVIVAIMHAHRDAATWRSRV